MRIPGYKPVPVEVEVGYPPKAAVGSYTAFDLVQVDEAGETVGAVRVILVVTPPPRKRR